MSIDYRGKNIWIIGASSGIGQALAIDLSTQQVNLALSARRCEALETLNANLGNKHLVTPVDVANLQQLQKVAKDIKLHFGTIDSIILLAALYEPTTCDNLDIEKTRAMLDVNVMGAFNVVHVILPTLKQQKQAQLVLCASIAGMIGLPGGQPYSATKAAIINLAQSLKAENLNLDIKVINCGFVSTPLTAKNNFTMPMIITPEQAAKHITLGLARKNFEIHFPKKFTLTMKLLSILPHCIYFRLVKKLYKV